MKLTRQLACMASLALAVVVMKARIRWGGTLQGTKRVKRKLKETPQFRGCTPTAALASPSATCGPSMDTASTSLCTPTPLVALRHVRSRARKSVLSTSTRRNRDGTKTPRVLSVERVGSGVGSLPCLGTYLFECNCLAIVVKYCT